MMTWSTSDGARSGAAGGSCGPDAGRGMEQCQITELLFCIGLFFFQRSRTLGHEVSLRALEEVPKVEEERRWCELIILEDGTENG